MWFSGNDLPGVMGAEAALHHLVLHGAVAGRRIILATAGDGAYPVAGALCAAGAEVTIADARHVTPDAPEGVHLLRGTRIEAATGHGAVRRAVLDHKALDADTVLMAGGWTPSVQLHCQAGGKLTGTRPGMRLFLALGLPLSRPSAQRTRATVSPRRLPKAMQRPAGLVPPPTNRRNRMVLCAIAARLHAKRACLDRHAE